MDSEGLLTIFESIRKNDHKSTTAQLSEFERLFAAEETAAQELAAFHAEDERMRGEIQKMRLLYDSVQANLDEEVLRKQRSCGDTEASQSSEQEQ